MGANIAEKDGKSSVFVVGEPAWHKLGTVLDKPATAKEAIMCAGLDYKVQTQKVCLKSGKEIQNKIATVREDTQDVFSVQSESYKPIQNIEAFNFFDSIAGENKAIYHSAGALGKGERIWIMVKLPDDIIIKNVDNIEKYLLLSNSHDGKSSLRMHFTPIRVVCQNTLNASMNSASNEQVRLRHTGNIQNKIQQARKALGLALSYYEEFSSVATKMAEASLNAGKANMYFDKVLGIDGKNPEAEISTKKQNIKGEIVSLFEGSGKGLDEKEIRRTAWTAYNSIVEYVDYHRVTTGGDNKRLNNIWFGGGANIKKRAFSDAMALVA